MFPLGRSDSKSLPMWCWLEGPWWWGRPVAGWGGDTWQGHEEMHEHNAAVCPAKIKSLCFWFPNAKAFPVERGKSRRKTLLPTKGHLAISLFLVPLSAESVNVMASSLKKNQQQILFHSLWHTPFRKKNKTEQNIKSNFKNISPCNLLK